MQTTIGLLFKQPRLTEPSGALPVGGCCWYHSGYSRVPSLFEIDMWGIFEILYALRNLRIFTSWKLGSGGADHYLGPDLLKAVKCSDVKAVSFLVLHGADVNCSDSVGNTALHHSVMVNNDQIIRLLLGSRRCNVSFNLFLCKLGKFPYFASLCNPNFLVKCSEYFGTNGANADCKVCACFWLMCSMYLGFYVRGASSAHKISNKYFRPSTVFFASVCVLLNLN